MAAEEIADAVVIVGAEDVRAEAVVVVEDAAGAAGVTAAGMVGTVAEAAGTKIFRHGFARIHTDGAF